MFTIYYNTQNQEGMLVDGDRADYDKLVTLARNLFAGSDVEATCDAQSTGPQPVTRVHLRRGSGTIRISYEEQSMVIKFAPFWTESLASALQFPPDERLTYPVRYHHHFEYIDGYRHVAADSLAAIFKLRY